jgi:hypothetical protein
MSEHVQFQFPPYSNDGVVSTNNSKLLFVPSLVASDGTVDGRGGVNSKNPRGEKSIKSPTKAERVRGDESWKRVADAEASFSP